jgi:aryl-alcohol dehydrogenase-like predicted oxidoreductase
MQYGQIPGVDRPVSRLIQGLAMISSAESERWFALLDEVYAGGCNTFDGAHGYGSGDVERTFGRWMHERGLQDELVIISKAAHHNRDRKRVTPYDISSDLHDSLARLSVDSIDLYLLHRDDPSVPVGPIVEVLNEHHAAGKIKVFGGSNWSHLRIQEANEYAEKHNLVPFTITSPNFSLAEQFEAPWAGCISISGEQGMEAREWYLQQGMPILAWSSVAGGFFSGRFRPDNLDTFTEEADKLCVRSYCRDENFQRLERAQQLAQERGMTVMQVAVAYVLNQPLNLFALIGSQTGDEFRANLAALDVKLTPEEMAWLDLRAEVPV